MKDRWFSPGTGTWHDDLVDASQEIARETKAPKCYAHPSTADADCPMCIAELEYLKAKHKDEG